jgi:hypothetical protein
MKELPISGADPGFVVRGALVGEGSGDLLFPNYF